MTIVPDIRSCYCEARFQPCFAVETVLFFIYTIWYLHIAAEWLCALSYLWNFPLRRVYCWICPCVWLVRCCTLIPFHVHPFIWKTLNLLLPMCAMLAWPDDSGDELQQTPATLSGPESWCRKRIAEWVYWTYWGGLLYVLNVITIVTLSEDN